MKKIESFTVDHVKMVPGVFVSRIDNVGEEIVTTFDIRMKTPNREPVLNVAPLHTIEHLGATFLRSHARWGSKTIYFGPMGCRTGFYLVVAGGLESKEILPLIRELFLFIAGFDGEVPGATAAECGNWRDQNLPAARWEAERYLEKYLNRMGEENLNYP